MFGHRIHLDPNDSLLLSINGVYEETEARLFEQQHPPRRRGRRHRGHIGYYTLLAARAVGDDGHVFAFEPERGNYALLPANVADNGYAAASPPINKAVMAQSGELEHLRVARQRRRPPRLCGATTIGSSYASRRRLSSTTSSRTARTVP